MNTFNLLITLMFSAPVNSYTQAVVIIDRRENIVVGSTQCILTAGENEPYQLPSTLAICIPQSIEVAAITKDLDKFYRPTTSVTLEDGYHRITYPTCNLVEKDGGIYLYDCMYAIPDIKVPLE